VKICTGMKGEEGERAREQEKGETRLTCTSLGGRVGGGGNCKEKRRNVINYTSSCAERKIACIGRHTLRCLRMGTEVVLCRA
jgi:hypothetical protein